MSAARFKSRDDYFSKKSNLTKKVIPVISKRSKKRPFDTIVPVSVMRDIFCNTIDQFEIEDKGRFKAERDLLDKALERHLDGDAIVLVNPLTLSGDTGWNVICFDSSDIMDHPFSKAQQYSSALEEREIPSLIEVSEGGKGHYHLWIFHEKPISGLTSARALIQLGRELFGIDLETSPSPEGGTFINLPLQGESVLFQRRVFVNSVGKMIKDQKNLLISITLCPTTAMEAFTEEMKGREEIIRVAETIIVVPEAPEQKVQKISAAEERHNIEEEPQLKEERLLESSFLPLYIETSRNSTPIDISEKQLMFLVFTINGDEYGIEYAEIDKITSASDVIAIPGISDTYMGVIVSNGTILSVAHLRLLFSHEITRPDLTSRIIVLNGTQGEYGLLVDKVSGLMKVPADSLFLSRTGDNYIRYAIECKEEKRLILILDTLKIVQEVFYPDVFVEGKQTKISQSVSSSKNEIHVIFSLSGQLFALPVDTVQEILLSRPYFSHSHSDKASSDSVVFRGKKLIVSNLKQKLGITGIDSTQTYTQAAKAKERIIIVNCGKTLKAFRVENVEGIQLITCNNMYYLPAIVRKKSSIKALARLGKEKEIIFIVDHTPLI